MDKVAKGFVLCSVALLFMCIPCKGQRAGFVEGYIVQNQGDTLTGYIGNWYKERTPNKIKFKKNLEDKHMYLYPLSIKSFFVDDEFYESRVLIVDKSPYARNELYLNQIPFSKERELIMDTVFLNVLVRGKIDLLYLYDEENKPHFFVESDDIAIDELINHQYKKKVNLGGGIKTTIQESKRYIGQLIYYLRDCTKAQKRVQKSKLVLKDMVNIIHSYNSCL